MMHGTMNVKTPLYVVLTIPNSFYYFLWGATWTVTFNGSIVYRYWQEMSEYESVAEW
jgi:hypothetical protein